MRLLVIPATVVIAVLIGCGPTDAEIRALVRAEIANVEIPAGPPGAPGAAGPPGPQGEPGASADIPPSLEVEELIVRQDRGGYLVIRGGPKTGLADIAWYNAAGVYVGSFVVGTRYGAILSTINTDRTWMDLCVQDGLVAPCPPELVEAIQMAEAKR